MGWEHRAGCPLCVTAPLRAAAAPCKPSLQKPLAQSCCISLSVLEDQSQPWLMTGAASSAPPAPKFVEFQLCYYTQARRCIHVISSCKGQQVRPRAALSSFVLLLSFFGLLQELPQNPAKLHSLNLSSSPKLAVGCWVGDEELRQQININNQ